jgi:hypothetical protein
VRKRPARTPPSTFLFLPIHFSNSPGTMAAPYSPANRRAVEAHTPDTVGCCFTVPVRSFRGAQSRRRRTARRNGYIGAPLRNCQPKRPAFATAKSAGRSSACGYPTGSFSSSCAALRPYSWVVLMSVSRDGIATGAPSLSIRVNPHRQAPSLTPPGPAGIVPAGVGRAHRLRRSISDRKRRGR